MKRAIDDHTFAVGLARRAERVRIHRCGITLIEVMAAGAMSVILLGALVLAMRTMQKQEVVIVERDRGFEPWKQQLRSTLEWDIINSRTWNHRFSSLRMTGFAGRSSSGTATLTETSIEYRFLSVQGDIWLVRDSTSMNSPDSRTERTLLCRGVRKILIGRPEDDLRSLLAPRGEFDTFFPIPSRVRCVLVDADDQPVLDFQVLMTGGGE